MSMYVHYLPNKRNDEKETLTMNLLSIRENIIPILEMSLLPEGRLGYFQSGQPVSHLRQQEHP